MTIFPHLVLFFHLSLPKVWPSHPLRNYFSEKYKYRAIVPDQIEPLSQVGTKEISKGGWTILEPFEQQRNHYLSFRSQSNEERVFTCCRN